ncbi:hypothetical protein NC653_005959 [Populus alba x Populus x berolinensis]|uniref:Uncharacterized protein n=1 Tax=Populus alba x Populus x berolinensis TaxID=444605 RepID=A0AAD6REI3_9ROSI|nr:hypothetical protein NC653_005959 [Populus alba x Populus x berolinensis]
MELINHRRSRICQDKLCNNTGNIRQLVDRNEDSAENSLRDNSTIKNWILVWPDLFTSSSSSINHLNILQENLIFSLSKAAAGNLNFLRNSK